VNLSSIGGHNVYPTAAVYCATKLRSGLSEALRQESTDIRITVISPVTETELASTTTDAQAAQWLEEFRESVIPADAIARAIALRSSSQQMWMSTRLSFDRSDRAAKHLMLGC